MTSLGCEASHCPPRQPADGRETWPGAEDCHWWSDNIIISVLIFIHDWILKHLMKSTSVASTLQSTPPAHVLSQNVFCLFKVCYNLFLHFAFSIWLHVLHVLLSKVELCFVSVILCSFTGPKITWEPRCAIDRLVDWHERYCQHLAHHIYMSITVQYMSSKNYRETAVRVMLKKYWSTGKCI